jgi:hypothetical protein
MEYEIENNEIEELFDSNGEHVFDNPKFFYIYVEKMSTRIERKYVFYELPYWEDIKFSHFLYPMPTLKNIYILYGDTYN